MGKYASKVVEQAKAWVGKKESDGSFKEIIDIYNSHKPLARGYKVKYTDEWCAAGGSAVAIKLDYTDIIPTECGCERQIELWKKLGCWIENENRTPTLAEWCYYDWQDDSKNYSTTDNKGWSDHAGIVVEVNGDTFNVVEFNYGGEVKIRTLKVNDRFIRGFGVPKYDAEPVKPTTQTTTTSDITITLSQLQKGSKGKQVETLQCILIARGYSIGDLDGDFGAKTDAGVRLYQKNKNLVVDGVVGSKTWNSLLK